MHRPVVTWHVALVLLCGIATAPAQNEASHVPIDAFEVPPGLEITVWATSPQLFNPTNIDIDHVGRIWVAEGVNYRGKKNRRKAGDRIVVLTDTDADGRADASHVFVQEPFLVAPLGVAVFDNKVVVAQPPDLLVYTDVDRDLRFDPDVDRREVLLTGFGGRNHDHSLHSATHGPDGLWYWNAGNCGAMFTDRSDRTFRIGSAYQDPHRVAGHPSDDGHVWIGGFTARMRPDGSHVEVIGHNYRNSYEQSVTSLGDVFQNDNDDPPACRVSFVLEYGNAGFCSRDGRRSWRADQRPGQTTPVAEWRQEDPGTMPAGDIYGGGSPTGVAFYENGALGSGQEGLLLTCEPGRNTIFGYRPEPNGAGFNLARTDWLTSNRERKFSGSDFTGGRWDGQLHTQFRPSDVAVGPDGAIYVADWFDGRVGGHGTLDKSLSGTIYRIAPRGFAPRVPAIDRTTTAGLITALCSPAVNVRHIGFVGLRAQGAAAVPALRELAGHENRYLAARAIHLLAQLGDAGRTAVERELGHDDATRRLVAFRALRRTGHTDLDLAHRLATDPSPAVRREVATSLRDTSDEASVAVLLQLTRGFDGVDRTYLDAIGIGCTGKESAVYTALAAEAGDPEAWSRQMDWLAWRLGAAESVAALVTRVRSQKLDPTVRRRALTALAFIRDAKAAAAMIDLASDGTCPDRAMAEWWCLNRMGNEWREFGVAAALRERGIYDPDNVTITPIAAPPVPKNAPRIAVADVLPLTGNASTGQTRVGQCLLCHKVGQAGVDFGPDITTFGRAQSREALIEAIVAPGKSIAHGYQGHTVETDAGIVEGIVLSHGDPLIIRSTGGVLQKLPRARVKKVRRLRRSLMWPTSSMGLDAQTVADLVAYLRSDANR